MKGLRYWTKSGGGRITDGIMGHQSNSCYYRGADPGERGAGGASSVSYAVDYTCTNIGTVTWQSPAAGTRVNRGAAVSVRVATAPRPPRECP